MTERCEHCGAEQPAFLVGEGLRAWRRARGWSREKLAKRVGVHVRTVIRWELGDCTPQGAGARALARLVRR